MELKKHIIIENYNINYSLFNELYEYFKKEYDYHIKLNDEIIDNNMNNYFNDNIF
jgi:hypothetical protein